MSSLCEMREPAQSGFRLGSGLRAFGFSLLKCRLLYSILSSKLPIAILQEADVTFVTMPAVCRVKENHFLFETSLYNSVTAL